MSPSRRSGDARVPGVPRRGLRLLGGHLRERPRRGDRAARSSPLGVHPQHRAGTFPDDPSKWLPDDPPCRTWYNKRRNPITDAALDLLRQRLTNSAIGIAREVGLLDPDGPGTPTHPDASRMIYHDGKAIRQLFNGTPGDTREVKVVDPETGEVRIEERPVRADPDAKVHITGDNRQVHGCKFWAAAIRGDDPFTRVILAVDSVPGVKDEQNSEADIAIKNLLELAPEYPVRKARCATRFFEVRTSTGCNARRGGSS